MVGTRMKRECETCIKRKTDYCPNSIECMDTNDMPFYQNRIMLLEENTKLINQQKEFIKYLQEELNVQIQEESIGCEITNKRYILEEILQKYKEIIGE